MGFVGNDHHVGPVAQQREIGFALQQTEFLDGREENAPRSPVAEQGAEVFAVVGLHGGFLQHARRVAELLEQLPVEVVAVGHHHERGVAHGGLLAEFARETGHRNALAAPLRVPHDAALPGAGRGGLNPPGVGRGGVVDFHRRRTRLHGGTQGLLHGGPHGVELVVGGDFLNQRAVRSRLEQHEVPQVIEEQFAVEKAPNDFFQLVLQVGLVVLASEGPPGHEPLPVGGERPDAGKLAVGHHERHVGQEQIGQLLPVGLELFVGVPHVGLLVERVFEFKHRHRQAIQKRHEVGAAGLAARFHRKLRDHQPVVAPGVVEIHEPGPVAAQVAVGGGHVHGHAVGEPGLHHAVAFHRVRVLGAGHALGGFAHHGLGQGRVEAAQCLQQPTGQQGLSVGFALGPGAVGRKVGAGRDGPAGFVEPLAGEVFEVDFVQLHGVGATSRMNPNF